MEKHRMVRRKELKGFGKKLRERREERKMNREEFAKLARISSGTLQKIEEGVVKNPSISTVMDIVNSLNSVRRVNQDDFANILGFKEEVSLVEESYSEPWVPKGKNK